MNFQFMEFRVPLPQSAYLLTVVQYMKPPTSYGATHLLERMAYKSTLSRSHLRIVREFEAIRGNIAAAA